MEIKEKTITGWIARDDKNEHNENGALALFFTFPHRQPAHIRNGNFILGYWWDEEGNAIELPNTMYPELTWENEPVYVKLTIEVLQ